MRKLIASLILTVAFVVAAPFSSFAITPKEQSFLDSYKKAFETKDEAALKSMLYTKGGDPEAIGFFEMMMTAEMGGKISSIELQDLSPEDLKKATATQPMPNGQMAKLVLNPTKKLVIKVASNDANGSSTSSSETFVAEADGKLVIPVPGPVK